MSKSIIRHDDGKANLTIHNVNKHLPALQSECIENDNSSSQHLKRKGLHLNPKGTQPAITRSKLTIETLEQGMKYVGNNLDIPMVSETKIDDTFPESQFLIEGFSTPYRLNRTAKVGGISLYIRQDIASKYLKKIRVNESFEGFFVELNLRNKKWLLRCLYNPHKEKNNFSP